MRSLKALIIALVLIFWAGVFIVNAQLTKTPGFTYEIRDPDGRLTYECWGDVQWDSLHGHSIKAVQSDDDLLRTALKDEGRSYLFVLDSIEVPGPDTGNVYFTVYTEAVRERPIPLEPYIAILKAHPQMEVVNYDVLPGMDFLLEDTTDLNVGDMTLVQYYRHTLNPHWPRRLRIYPPVAGQQDTLPAASGIVTTKAVSNRYTYLGLEMYGCGITADTSFNVKVGYMLKNDGGEWMGDGNDATRLDTLFFKYDDNVVLLNNKWGYTEVTHEQSDSIKFFVSGLAPGRNILKDIIIKQHN